MLANIPHQNDIIKNGSGGKTPLLIKLKREILHVDHGQHTILGIMSTWICLHLEDFSGPGIGNFIRTWGIKWYQTLHGSQGHLSGWRGWGAVLPIVERWAASLTTTTRGQHTPPSTVTPKMSSVIATVRCRGGGWIGSVRMALLRCTFQQKLSPVNKLETEWSD